MTWLWGLLAQEPAPVSWIEYVDTALSAGLMLSIIWALLTRRVIPRSTHDEIVADLRAREEHARTLAYHALGIGEKVVEKL